MHHLGSSLPNPAWLKGYYMNLKFESEEAEIPRCVLLLGIQILIFCIPRGTTGAGTGQGAIWEFGFIALKGLGSKFHSQGTKNCWKNNSSPAEEKGLREVVPC